jgi:hypothetical protein
MSFPGWPSTLDAAGLPVGGWHPSEVAAGRHVQAQPAGPADGLAGQLGKGERATAVEAIVDEHVFECAQTVWASSDKEVIVT